MTSERHPAEWEKTIPLKLPECQDNGCGHSLFGHDGFAKVSRWATRLSVSVRMPGRCIRPSFFLICEDVQRERNT